MDSLREAVLSRLDQLDRAAGDGDPSTLLPLARTGLHRLADGWRDLLASHHADESGRCPVCARGLRARRRPCPIWQAAHEQLVGDGGPHRARTGPLRNPFRPHRRGAR